jgi:hypothetical protein
VLGEVWAIGKDAGQVKVDANVDLNFKFLGDTVRLAASGFFHSLNPTFYQRHRPVSASTPSGARCNTWKT